mmetsp:Transcript_10869/g.20668  ORF Transcript_10869/g.20668 Transcript_10869/m.20668 type:complete len:317 (+) Transcript_10869:1006-1956(+)
MLVISCFLSELQTARSRSTFWSASRRMLRISSALLSVRKACVKVRTRSFCSLTMSLVVLVRVSVNSVLSSWNCCVVVISFCFEVATCVFRSSIILRYLAASLEKASWSLRYCVCNSLSSRIFLAAFFLWVLALSFASAISFSAPFNLSVSSLILLFDSLLRSSPPSPAAAASTGCFGSLIGCLRAEVGLAIEGPLAPRMFSFRSYISFISPICTLSCSYCCWSARKRGSLTEAATLSGGWRVWSRWAKSRALLELAIWPGPSRSRFTTALWQVLRPKEGPKIFVSRDELNGGLPAVSSPAAAPLRDRHTFSKACSV